MSVTSSALTFTDGGNEIDHPGRQVRRTRFQPQSVLGVQRRELGELETFLRAIDGSAVDCLHRHQRVELFPTLAFFGLANLAGNSVTFAQPELADEGKRDIHVIRAGEVSACADKRIVLQNVNDSGYREQYVVFGNYRF
jgi:hypothetical protein